MLSFEEAKWYDNNLNNDNLRLLCENLNEKANQTMFCFVNCDAMIIMEAIPPLSRHTHIHKNANCARSFIIQITGSETNDLFFVFFPSFCSLFLSRFNVHEKNKKEAGSSFSFWLFVSTHRSIFHMPMNVAHIMRMYSYIINFSKWHLANKAWKPSAKKLKKMPPRNVDTLKEWNATTTTTMKKEHNVRNTRHFAWLLSTSWIYRHEPNIHSRLLFHPEPGIFIVYVGIHHCVLLKIKQGQCKTLANELCPLNIIAWNGQRTEKKQQKNEIHDDQNASWLRRHIIIIISWTLCEMMLLLCKWRRNSHYTAIGFKWKITWPRYLGSWHPIYHFRPWSD